ncbi:MAG: UMP kinase [Candidatus Doudnabacteria bacterium]|nr:UMP kinase [Candidatus Doudnabacteria bacterium]
MKKLFVLSLGGSLVVPEEIDVKFLKNFKKLIEAQTKKGHRFIIIAGGGKICRKYQAALRQITAVNNKTLDWMGIYTTHTNAQLVRLIFGKLARPEIVNNPTKKFRFKQKILLAGGWIPGSSTDKDAVLLAKAYGAKTVINLSNIDYLYTKDPRKFKDAQKVTKLSWNQLLKITGRKWSPGANLPFDPQAAKLAQKSKIRVVIANGKDLKNLQSIINGKNFKGSTVG